MKINNANILNVSYFPRKKTIIGFCPLPDNVLDLLIDGYPAFKRAIWYNKEHEFTKVYFQFVQHLFNVLKTIPPNPRYSKKLTNIISIDNSDLSYLSIRTSQVFVIFKYALLFLFMLNKLNPSDGKKSKFLSTTPTYPKFASTYKRCHFMITCSSCMMVTLSYLTLLFNKNLQIQTTGHL
eukprot:TRINITY_DN70_c0_g1_i10.p1 TRINITY_DN70_c0_g1~~TRINITY_DN70_c0_g1_i10.p1  ORF type:complete len:180 (+),score=8.11 TRINITY_DN70_c0_g1_i10:315-854(+)